MLPLGFLLFVVVLADASVNWYALRNQLAIWPTLRLSALFTFLFLFWGLIAGKALAPVWGQPAIAFLVRQPISRWRWVRFLAPSLLIAFLPLIGIWWLAPNHGNTVVHYLGFVGLAWPIILGASFHGKSRYKWLTIGTTSFAILTFTYTYQGWVSLLAIIITIAFLPMSSSAIREQTVSHLKAKPGNLKSKTPVMAVIRRDFRCLWCLERKTLFVLVQLGVVTLLMMLAIRINTEAGSRMTFIVCSSLLAFGITPIYEILSRLATHLGPELMRHRWPISHLHRGLALLGLVFLLTAPVFMLLGILGSAMGAAYLTLFTLQILTSLVVLCGLFCHTLLDTGTALGWGLWVALINTLLVTTLPPWIYVTMLGFVVPAGVVLMVRGLKKFTLQTETGTHG